mgnify:CR=1 FL=1
MSEGLGALFNQMTGPHRRFNPLLQQWVLVSPNRTQRPWQGKQEKLNPSFPPKHDPDCYLCSGNERANGCLNANYPDIYVFDNDFSALNAEASPAFFSEHKLTKSMPVTGKCRVICFSPQHNLSLAEMGIDAIGKVIECWRDQYVELVEDYAWVQIFENKGAIMGASNVHPHGQVWACDYLPTEPSKVDENFKSYFLEHASPMLMDYVRFEQRDGARTVEENDHWLAVVPYWALWPFELLLLPRIPVRHLGELNAVESRSLAEILKRCLVRYDNLFETSFPYSMGWHQAPGAISGVSKSRDHWQLHAHFYPPLLRSATVKKFMVGFEMLGEGQRDITPEQAAEKLLSVSGSNLYRAND